MQLCVIVFALDVLEFRIRTIYPYDVVERVWGRRTTATSKRPPIQFVDGVRAACSVVELT